MPARSVDRRFAISISREAVWANWQGLRHPTIRLLLRKGASRLMSILGVSRRVTRSKREKSPFQM
jgi:hypothetical protein